MTASTNKPVSLELVARHCRGQLLGDPTFEVSRLAGIETADSSCLGFIRDADKVEMAADWRPGAVLLRATDRECFAGNRIIVEDPYLAYAEVSELFLPPAPAQRIHDSAVIHVDVQIGTGVCVGVGSVLETGCHIGSDVVIGHHVVVGENTVIGDGSTVESGVILGRQTSIGKRCHISPGVVIGASGFGYALQGKQWKKIHQIGAVTIGDDVDIGANTTLYRGAIDNTFIGHRVKLDNQIQIAHNVQVGDDTIMAGCVAVAGSAVIGSRCQIGGRASILGHLHIADEVILQADAFVAQSITKPGVYASMIPAQPVKQWRKVVGHLNRLEQLARKVRALSSDRTEKTK